LVGAVHGEFERFRGHLIYDPANIGASRISWEVQVDTINTGIAKRDHHLASHDYFDAKEWPTLKFVSRSVRPLDPRHFQVTGEMTMLGVTKTMTVPVTMRDDGWMDCQFPLARGDFGFTAGEPAVADRVDVHLRLYPSPTWFRR
jgi:polyisoprenoid-binding protein YceI